MHPFCLTFTHMKEAVVGKLLKSSPTDFTFGGGVVTYLVFPAIETNSSENVIASGGISPQSNIIIIYVLLNVGKDMRVAM